jgi:hypothetical protein
MLDTLKLTKRLEGAGLERQVAEAMAEAFAESTSETVATKDDLRHEAGGLRAPRRRHWDRSCGPRCRPWHPSYGRKCNRSGRNSEPK